jgi:hypothetical protein
MNNKSAKNGKLMNGDLFKQHTMEENSFQTVPISPTKEITTSNLPGNSFINSPSVAPFRVPSVNDSQENAVDLEPSTFSYRLFFFLQKFRFNSRF